MKRKRNKKQKEKEEENEIILELKDISKNFGGVHALKKCSFYVKQGRITGLIGPNGAGKTTAFNVINGFIKPDSGDILLNGESITGKRPDLIANAGVSRTFQMIRLFNNLSIEENLLLALSNENSFFKSLKKKRKPSDPELKKIKKALSDVGLKKETGALAGELSYGQKKLLEIARALLKEHSVLLLDEPTAGVNPKLRQQLKDILRKLKKQGKTILVIEHDMEFIMDISDEVVVLDSGTKLTADTPEKVRNNPKVLEAYLGD